MFQHIIRVPEFVMLGKMCGQIERQTQMRKEIFIVVLVAVIVALAAVSTLTYQLPIGPIVFATAFVPLAAIVASRHRISSAVPDLVFGSIDTGLLTIPALVGGLSFGVAGAIAGGVVGDALTDAIAGFFEGHVATWMRDHGFEESREALTTSLGKMAGCLLGSGAVLSVAFVFGVSPQFA